MVTMNASIGLRIFNENYRQLRFVTKLVTLPTCSVSLRVPVGVTQSTHVRADETRQYAKGDLLGKGGVMCF